MLSGPLPMSLNRIPQAVPGMLLIGDAAGAVNPFNGEGIAYAMEMRRDRGRTDPRGAGAGPARDRDDVPRGPAGAVRRLLPIGRGFARMIGRPAIMGAATQVLLPRPRVMGFAMRLMANLTDGRDGDAQDRLLSVLERSPEAS